MRSASVPGNGNLPQTAITPKQLQSTLDGEIFEILLTFEDFLEFKQLMLNYKSVIILFILKMILLNFQTFQTFLYIIGKFALILEKNSNLFMF